MVVSEEISSRILSQEGSVNDAGLTTSSTIVPFFAQTFEAPFITTSPFHILKLFFKTVELTNLLAFIKDFLAFACWNFWAELENGIKSSHGWWSLVKNLKFPFFSDERIIFLHNLRQYKKLPNTQTLQKPVFIWTLKLSNIGPGPNLNGRQLENS